jgi:hypothetical protein
MLLAAKAVANDRGFVPFGGFSSAEGELETVGMETGFDIPDAPGVVAYLEETMLKDEVAKGARVVAWASSCESTAQGRPLGRRGVSGMASAAHACILRGARRSAAERQAPRTPSQHT